MRGFPMGNGFPTTAAVPLRGCPLEAHPMRRKPMYVSQGQMTPSCYSSKGKADRVLDRAEQQSKRARLAPWLTRGWRALRVQTSRCKPRARMCTASSGPILFTVRCCGGSSCTNWPGRGRRTQRAAAPCAVAEQAGPRRGGTARAGKVAINNEQGERALLIRADQACFKRRTAGV